MPVRVEIDGVGQVEFSDNFRQKSAQEQQEIVNQIAQQQVGGQQEEPQSALETARQTLSDTTEGVAQGIPFSDEIMAGVAAPFRAGYEAITGQGEGGLLDRLASAYTTEVTALRDRFRRANERSPVASTVGSIAGGLAFGGTAAKGGATLLNATKATYPQMIGRGAAEGAAYGALYGAGEGEGVKDRLSRAAGGAAVGGLTGAALGGVGARQARKQARRAIPDSEQLRAQKIAAYNAVDEAGVRYMPPETDALVSAMQGRVKGKNISPKRHPNAYSMMEDLEDLRGHAPTLTELDQLRQTIRRDVAGDPAEEFFAREMIDEIDNFIESAGRGSEVMTMARELNKRFRKSELIEEAVNKAERRAASTGSGGNVDNAIRQNIRAILDKPKKGGKSLAEKSGFTKQEIELLEKVVRGGSVQNLMRLVGKLSPQGNGLMMALGIGGVAYNPLLAPLVVGGALAKRSADAATPRNVAAALDVIRTGGSGIQVPALSAGNRALLEGTIFGGAPLATP